MDSFLVRVKELKTGFFTGFSSVDELNPAVIDKLGGLLKKPDDWYCFLEQLHSDAPDFGKRYRYLKCLSQKELYLLDDRGMHTLRIARFRFPKHRERQRFFID